MRGTALAILASLLLISAAAPSRAAVTDDLDLNSGKVLAMVGDKVITTLDVAARMRDEPIPSGLDAKGRKERLNQLALEALDQLIENELVLQDFKGRKGKIPVEDLQSRIDRVVVAQANGDEEKFRDLLHENNMTYNDFVEQLKQSLAVEMMVYDRTRRHVTVTDQQVRDYFYSHAREFTSQESFRPQVILLKPDGRHAGNVPAVAGEILAKCQEGADFGALAKEYSEGANAEEGGDMGWQSDLAPAFREVLVGLKPGQVYPGMLKIGQATYLVRLADYRPGVKPVLDDAAVAKIKGILTDEIAKRKYEEYIKQLYQKFPVRRMVPTADTKQ